MTPLTSLQVLLAACLVVAPSAFAETIAEKTGAMRRIDGFVPLYWDDAEGKLYAEIGRWDQELLYVTSLAAGIGSNDIGLDRGQLSGTRIVRFERVGPRVLLIQPNTDYRAISDNAEERRAVEEAFARSVLWGFEVVAETDGRALVDATDFAMRDAHGVQGSLKQSGQGDFELDPSRSALYLPRTKGFPRNTEIEVTLTFTADELGGDWLRSVSPDAQAVTVRERHSLIQLPGPGYEPRYADPRGGYFGVTYRDYATPLGEGMERRLISRHRLEKKDPGAAVSEPVEPIVYYLDSGTPEPVRSALLDGARWWNAGFERAGFKDAFRVEMLPPGADALDIRYNVIQWIHRSTRGWSYGSSVTDPRTGEIIKGHVSLGSLRVRQDYLIAEGLLSPYESGDEVPPELAKMALARIRQLSAHEVGHTLGLAHNYIASVQGRASVMDYPHPLVELTSDGSVDLSDAYATGVGEWDKVAIHFGYADFPEGTDEAAAMKKILADARENGITFISDQDARPPGSAHPQVHLWDNGQDAAAELNRMMQVREAALERFGERAIRRGRPMATMEEALVPLYLHHRYQIEAAAKVVGGLSYEYAMRGDGLDPPQAVPASQQRSALEALLDTLEPAALAFPRSILERLPPRPFRYPSHRELFPRNTGLVFDAIAPASVAADMTMAMLLHPERAARLIQQHALDPSLPSMSEVTNALVDATFDAPSSDAYEAEIGRSVQRVVVDRLIGLAATAPMAQVRALATRQLEDLQESLERRASADSEDGAHADLLVAHIGRFLDRDADAATLPERLELPPGSPIGSWAADWLEATKFCGAVSGIM